MIASNGSDQPLWFPDGGLGTIDRMEANRAGGRAAASLLESMLRGLCEPGRLLDFVENFTLFSEHKSGLVKAIGRTTNTWA